MSETNSTSIISTDDLFAKYAEYKNGRNKSLAIVQSTSGIVSTIASSLLILTIFRSPKRLSSTYHRLLLGMSISDILLSLSFSTFQASSPTDVSYFVWNARGNQATCTAQGVFATAGIAATLCYSCSLNFYYLAMVKHNKTETYIRTKLERFLHGVPILIALVCSIAGLVNKNYNDSGGGDCTLSPIYNPEHCIGYDEGEVREGFEIPCGRGRLENLYALSMLLLLFVPPIIMCVSLGMIYRSVVKQEKKIARYGVGALNPSAQQTNGDDGSERANEGNGRQNGSFASIVSSIKSRFSRRESSNSHAGDGDNSNSRAVVHKALAYTISYFLAWILTIFAVIIFGEEGEAPIAYAYIWSFMTPLQGLFNFLIYLHPKVVKAKRTQGQNLSWCQALGTAFWSGINGPKKKTNTPRARHVAGGNKDSPQPDGDTKKNPPAATSDKKGNSYATDSTTSLQITYNRKGNDIEEEKTEIRAPEDDDNWGDSALETGLESNETR